MGRMRIDVDASIGTDDEARADGVAGATITVTSLDGSGTFVIATAQPGPAPVVTGANPGTSWTFTAGVAGDSYLLRNTVGAIITERELIIPSEGGAFIPARQSHALEDTRDQNITAARISASTYNASGHAYGYAALMENNLRLVGRASRLRTTVGTPATDVVISGTPPSNGQVLQATGATAAAWATPVAPAGTFVDASIQTDSGTPTKTIHTYATLAADRVIALDLTFMAADHANEEVGVFRVVAAFYRPTAGAVEEREVTRINGPYRQDTNWSIGVAASGTNIVLTVTGDAVQDTEWRVTGQVIEHG